MKKNISLFSLLFVSSLVIFTSCSTTPKYAAVPVVYATTNYAVAQPPVRLEIENKGRQWNQFVREYNAERLEHNLRQAQIENRGAEQSRAKELGVEYTPPTLGQQQTVSAAGNGGVHFYSPYPQVRPFFGTPSYFYTPSGGYGVYGGGTYMYGGAGAYGNLGGGNCQPRGRLFGINFRQSSPGYRHTGGPMTEIHQHSIGGVGFGAGGFTSGLNFYRPW